jgi:hypothetical protein
MRRRALAGKERKNPTREVSGVVVTSPSLTLLTREGVYKKAMQAGLLTDGSSYSPTPSQRIVRQWPILLAFVPDHSGAPVRELHPLPVKCYLHSPKLTYQQGNIILGNRCQAVSSEAVVALPPSSLVGARSEAIRIMPPSSPGD